MFYLVESSNTRPLRPLKAQNEYTFEEKILLGGAQ